MNIYHPGTEAVLFTAAELASQDDGTIRLVPGFATALTRLRVAMDEPMVVTSCCRTPARNAAIGGSPRSYHLTEGNASNGTCALDVRVPDDIYRLKLAMLAMETGWTVGVYRTFLHLDRRLDFGAEPFLFYGK